MNGTIRRLIHEKHIAQRVNKAFLVTFIGQHTVHSLYLTCKEIFQINASTGIYTQIGSVIPIVEQPAQAGDVGIRIDGGNN